MVYWAKLVCLFNGKSHSRTGHIGTEEKQRNNSTLSLTSSLWVGGQRHAPAVLPPGKRLGINCTEGWPIGPGGETLASTVYTD